MAGTGLTMNPHAAANIACSGDFKALTRYMPCRQACWMNGGGAKFCASASGATRHNHFFAL